MELAEGSAFPYLFVLPTNFQPPQAPAPGGTKLTSVLCKGTVSFPALGFLQVWESDTSQKDKAVKYIFEKDRTSKVGSGVSSGAGTFQRPLGGGANSSDVKEVPES